MNEVLDINVLYCQLKLQLQLQYLGLLLFNM